jgi:hypothetical protein
MPFQATVFRVLIASPSDVSKERDALPNVFHNWNTLHAADLGVILLPVKWETASRPQMGGRPQALLNEQFVDDCDVLLGVFWTRIGSHTGVAESGTVEEIERFLNTGKPAMLYFSDARVEPSKVDRDQYEKLQAFKKKCRDLGVTHEYRSVRELCDKVEDHLTRQVRVLRSRARASKLEVRHSQDAPYRYVRNQYTYHRIGVYNRGPGVAENVEVWLDDIAPPPREPIFRADFPYRVRRVGHPNPESTGCPINPDAEEYFEIASSWISGSDNRLMVGGMDTKEDGEPFAVPFDVGESWVLKLRVSTATSEPLTAAIRMRAKDGALYLEHSQASEEPSAFLNAHSVNQDMQEALQFLHDHMVQAGDKREINLAQVLIVLKQPLARGSDLMQEMLDGVPLDRTGHWDDEYHRIVADLITAGVILPESRSEGIAGRVHTKTIYFLSDVGRQVLRL